MTSIEWVPSDQSEWLCRSPRRSPRSMSCGRRAGERRLDLAPVLAQLGLDERQAEERVRLRLGGERPELGGVAGERLAVLADAQEALLGQAPALVAGALAEADVVLLGAREVDAVGAGGTRRHDHEVDLRAAQQADRGLVAALVDDVVDDAQRREPLDEARPVVGLGEEVEVADRSRAGAGTSRPARSRLRPGVSVRASTRPRIVASARWRSIRCGADSRRAMPSRISCSVCADRPLSSRSRPASAAWRRSSIDSMPSSARSGGRSCGPRPGIRSSSTRPGGTSAHQPVVVGHPAGRGELLDLVADRGADAGDPWAPRPPR